MELKTRASQEVENLENASIHPVPLKRAAIGTGHIYNGN